MAYVGGSVMSKNMMSQSRTQFYTGNGSGRDTYIYNNNGGFCPFKQPTKIEELGTALSNSFSISSIIYLL
jgi:hypothetical protein